jgi:hypothetical protein
MNGPRSRRHIRAGHNFSGELLAYRYFGKDVTSGFTFRIYGCSYFLIPLARKIMLCFLHGLVKKCSVVIAYRHFGKDFTSEFTVA